MNFLNSACVFFSVGWCLAPNAAVQEAPFQPMLHQIVPSGPSVKWPFDPPNSPFLPPGPLPAGPSHVHPQKPALLQPAMQLQRPAMSQPVMQLQRPAMPQPVMQTQISRSGTAQQQQSFIPNPPLLQPNFQPPKFQPPNPQLVPKVPLSPNPISHSGHHHHQVSHEGQPLIPLPQGPGVNYCPDGIRVRKEFRDLTPQEWLLFKNTLKRMYEIFDEFGHSIIDRITKIHLDYGDVSHYTAHFLPWHRILTWMMETEMRKIEPTITIPYWDWTYDAHNPSKSLFFDEFYLGTKRGSKGDCNWRVSYPKKHCLVRNFKALKGFYSRRSLDKIIKDHSLSYAQFAEKFEVGPHGIVHTEIGGDGGDMTDMMSPNDPAFWLHHSFVELIFLEWQMGRGRNDEFGGEHRGKKAKRTDWLRPFRISVADSLDHRKFCYTYQPFSRRLAPLTGSNSTRTAEDQGPRVPIGKLPLSWIEMHGMTEERVRAIEQELKAYEEDEPDEAPVPPNKKASIAFAVAIVLGVVISIIVAIALYRLCSGDK